MPHVVDQRRITRGHLSAFFTVSIWGTTFIATKVLLSSFSPGEILFFRLGLAYVTLLLISPHIIKYKNIREELLFAAAGLSGITLAFLFQNTALSYTSVSNTSVLMSTSPFFTAILAHFFLKDEELSAGFFTGLGAAIAGIVLIAFNGNFILKLNPLGDLLAVLSAAAWAVYSILMKKISALRYNNIQCTQKIFFYGLFFLIPMLGMLGFKFNPDRFASLPVLLNILYLGIGASALCYVSWNLAVSVLGAVKTSVYIYVEPVIAVAASVVFLSEIITPTAAAGMALIMAGLYLSEWKGKKA